MTNLILKAHLEGVEMFKGITAQGYTTPRNSHKVLDPDLLMDIEEVVKSFLTTYGTNLLNAAKEAGPGELEHGGLNKGETYNQGMIQGHNLCRSYFLSGIDEGIEEIKKNQ